MSINNFTNIHVKVQFLKQNCEDIKQTIKNIFSFAQISIS